MTTMASGPCTSAPAPVSIGIGTKPRLVTSAVVRIGCNRNSASSRTASGANGLTTTNTRILRAIALAAGVRVELEPDVCGFASAVCCDSARLTEIREQITRYVSLTMDAT